MTATRVVVVGGGVTGLTFASTLIDELAGRGINSDIRLIESAPEAGGHARTLVDDGWLVESGPNGFLDSEPEALSLVDQLGLTSRLIESSAAARHRFIVRKRQLLQVPSSPGSFLTSNSLSFCGKLRLLGEPWAPGPPKNVDETVFAFAERRIGREAAETFVDTVVSGISGGDSRALSLRSQFPVLHEWEEAHGSLVKAAFARRKKSGGRTRLLTFDRGLGVLTSALAERLGSRAVAGVAVGAIEREGSEWRVSLSNGTSLGAERVVFATPSHVTGRVLGSTDDALAAALSSIPYAGLAVIAMGFRNEDVSRSLDGYGYLVPRSEQLATLGVLWESSIFPGRAPSGRALLRVVLGGASRPDVPALDEEAIAALARSELKAVMGVSAEPERQWIFRWPKAIAQYTVGHSERVQAISTALAAHPGLGVCGTAYDGVSFTSAVASARRSARQLADRLSGRS